MPRYDYKCNICEHTEELEYSISEVPENGPICPDCSHGLLKKVILPAAISFKGSGFYSTDNRKTQHVRQSLKVGGSD
jgi:putative FmdB family regulatory protein